MNINTSICAISTAPGHGGIAVIRISGPEAIKIADTIFLAASGKTLSETYANKAVFGRIIENNSTIDEVLVTVFRAPHSFTGENTVEINCHGSLFLQQKIVTLLITNGAEAAKPGEFTQRAYLNGKMDLSQAEAVADLINAESEAAHKMALDQMKGGISKQIVKLRSEMLHFISLVELELDFSEEDVEFADRAELITLIDKTILLITKLTDSFTLGNAIKTGVPTVIVGKPNAGKSTLLNNLVNEERAIVSDIPGTTRDSIEDSIYIKGIRFRFIDTAGLRQTGDVIENLGIERTWQNVAKAAIIVLICDASDSTATIENQIADIKSKSTVDNNILLLLNKSDLCDDQTLINRSFEGIKTISISAKHSSNIESVIDVLVDMSSINQASKYDVILSNIRHYEALTHTNEALQRAKEAIIAGIPQDLLAIDIREALYYSGSITGEVTTNEVLGNIFENFCIGK